MGEEKQQGENRAGNGSAQGRRPVSGRSSIYGSKESQQMMKRSAQHSAQARRRVQTGEEKRAVSGYEKRTKKEGVQSGNVKAGVEERRSEQTASGVPAERNIKKAVTRSETENRRTKGTTPQEQKEQTKSQNTKKAERTSEQKIEKGKNESSEARRTSLTESEGVSVRPERKKVSGSLSISENGNAPKKSRKSASEEQKAGSSKKTESEASTPRPHIGSHKFLSRCLWGLGSIMLIVYIAVAVYFSSHFYEDTEIYGIDCSQKSVEEVKKLVAEKLDEYRLEVKERGGASEYLSADQIDLKFVDNSSIDRMARAQRSYIWPVMLLMERNDVAGVAFTYDQKKALTAFKDLECMNPIYTKAPTDAYVQVTDSGFEVVKETEGNTLNPETTAKALYAALDGGKSVLDLEEEDCYLKPDLYSDDEALVAEAEAKDVLVQADITYEFGSRQERVNAPVIAQWITQAADGSYVIDDVEVTEYVEALAAKYDTFGLPRQFYTSLGTTVTLTDGDYGWCMDQDATVVDLLNALGSGYQGTMEPQYTYTAMSREENDIGDTYVEICISQQVMWCYKDGVCIVYTPVVTGNPNKGNATPSNGVWSIDAKMQNYTLVGEGYRSPVDFWMPFNGNVGIHDMQTRAYFGGTIYLTNGSHGCINTPYANAKTIYENVSIGTPVIVYD
ncbi:MAG: L,D-transpeptidase family protein [Lachnospiraceae bacterium]